MLHEQDDKPSCCRGSWTPRAG